MFLRILKRVFGIKKVASIRPKIEADEYGIREIASLVPHSFAWHDIVRVEIVWSENPWGDPQWGRYNDTEWLIWSRSGHGISLPDAEENRVVLLPALRERLEGFYFNYDDFDRQYGYRVFDKESGTYIVWNRNI